MDFVAVVDQVIVLLRQRGCRTSRTLQRQFPLDDDALHNLTDELLYAHPEVRDDAGRGLVWTGDAGTARSASRVSPPGRGSRVWQQHAIGPGHVWYTTPASGPVSHGRPPPSDHAPSANQQPDRP